MRKLTERQEKLYRFLQRRESSKRRFHRNDIVAATGYTLKTVDTYLRKMLVGSRVTVVARDIYKTIGMLQMAPPEFGRLMTQSKVPSGFSGWKARIEDLAALGVQKHHQGLVYLALRDLATKYQLIRLRTKT
jgi:hypothetical protein